MMLLKAMQILRTQECFLKGFYYNRFIHSQANLSQSKHAKVLILGGGAGGCSAAAKFKHLGKDLIIVEPSDNHFYQPMWTLVGAGLKEFSQSKQSMKKVLPESCTWIQESVKSIESSDNIITTSNGIKISYDYLVVAMGIQLDYEAVSGLPEALTEDSRVCSNYSANTVLKTKSAFNEFLVGLNSNGKIQKKAVFTFPNTPIKCAGAPQKIMYLFDDFLRKNLKRHTAGIQYFTSLPNIFGIKHYADKLWELCYDRNIEVTLRTELYEMDHKKSTAIFRNLDTQEKSYVKYDLLHATPPMKAFNVLKTSALTDESGFVTVDKETLQHTKFSNVFAIGDCNNCPTSKTAAAVAGQIGVLTANLKSVMDGKDPNILKYDGYTSCPIVTGNDKCILAEFDYTGQPAETFPWDQRKESHLSYFMKAHIMPQIYWHLLLRGQWDGPGVFRKLFHPGQ